jgi:hypothetical protein
MLLLLGCESTVEAPGGQAGVGGAGGDAALGGAGGDIGGGATAGACEFFCSEVPGCAVEPDCLGSCEDKRPEACGAEYDAVLTCTTPYLDESCKTPDDICTAERQAFESCIVANGPTQCTSVEYTDGGTSCEGSGPCLNGQTGRVTCNTQNDDSIRCRCYVDTAFLGECDEPALACALETSCCEKFF